MRRVLPLLALALALVAAACGGTAVVPVPSTTVASVPEGAGSVVPTSPEVTVTPTATTAPTTRSTVDGPPAPDFTLRLADGTEFVLSRETRPVYLVFWAEW